MPLLFFMVLLLISPSLYAGACIDSEESYTLCIEKPDQCPLEGYYNTSNPNFAFPKWFDKIPQEKRDSLNKFIFALSCRPLEQWNLGEGQQALSLKAEMTSQLRRDVKMKSYLEKYLVPQVKQHPPLLQSPIIRFYLTGMDHPLVKGKK